MKNKKILRTKNAPYITKQPVRVLPVCLNIFERLMRKQINSYITDYLSPFKGDIGKAFAHKMHQSNLLKVGDKV